MSRNNDPFFLSILNPKVALSVCNLHLRFGGGSALSYRHTWKPFFSLAVADFGGILLSLGHIGVFRALAAVAELDAAQVRC